jgi:hypothetical protein
LAYIKLKHESITHDLDEDGFVTLLGAKVTYSGKKNNSSEPNANGNDMVEVQTQSYNNPTLNIANIKLHDTSYLNMKDIQALYKAKYDGSNPIELVVAYGSDNVVLPSLLHDTSIWCVLESFTVDLDARNSDQAYMPFASLTFTETK